MSSSLSGKRVAVYARHSSALQNEHSADDQVRRCVEAARAAGADVNSEFIFKDEAVSAASLQRPGFERLMKAVDEKRVDVILVEDMSRISRDFADAAFIFKRLQYLDVALIGVADGVNTGLKTAKLTFTMSSLVADLSLDTLRDKTLRGLEARFHAGYSTGGLPLGYRSVPDLSPDGRVRGNLVVVDEEECAYRPSRSPVSAHRDHVFRAMAITRTGASRSERSDVSLGVWSDRFGVLWLSGRAG